ncbi:hypothetical protein VTO42DRAFT_7589 [Malbranchea cinnamomea]
MDYLNKLSGAGSSAGQQDSKAQEQEQGGGGGMFSGLGNKLHAAAGGGPESEKNEDPLDKGVDFVQQRFMGQGPQDNESAIEQAKDEQISDFIRGKYKGVTGSDFPGKDK